MSLIDFDDSYRSGLIEFLRGGAALPDDVMDLAAAGSPEDLIELIHGKSMELLKTSLDSSEISAKRKAAVLSALARDVDNSMCGDHVLRASGFNKKFRSYYETARGGIDNV